jgi:hypothetical protein
MPSALSAHQRPCTAAQSPRDAAVDDRPSYAIGRGRWRLLGMGAAVLTMVLVVSAMAPPVALGGIPTPLDPLRGLGDAITGGFGSMAVEAFDAIIKHLFAPISKLMTAELIGWLVEIPAFTGGHVQQLQTTIVAMGGALLGAVATLAVVRYWLVGLAGDGFGALEGLVHTVAAAFALAMWPWVFAQAVQLTNLFTGSLLGADSVVKPCAEMLAVGLGAAMALPSGIGVFLGLLIAAVASVLFLGLLLLKVAMTVSTLLIFVGMPLAIVLWPIAPSVPGLVGRAFMVCLAVPVTWAICFATSAVIVLDSLMFTGGGSTVDKLLKPLVAIVLLYIMVKVPTGLARMAMVGGQALRGGFVARTIGYAARRRASNIAEDHVTNFRGGRTRAPRLERDSQPHEQRGHVRPARTPPTADRPHAVGSGGGSNGGGVGAGPAVGARPAGYVPPPSAQGRAIGRSAERGLPTPAFRKEDFEAELFEAEHRERNTPVSPDQARGAVQALPEAAQRGIAAAVRASSGKSARRELAYRATAGEWSADEREALRTLAAATPDVRGQAFTGLDVDGESLSGGGEAPARLEEAPLELGQRSSPTPTAGPHPERDGGASGVAPRDQQDPADKAGAPNVPPREQRPPEGGDRS